MGRSTLMIALMMVLVGASLGAESIEIPARDHAEKSENVRPVDPRWDGLVVCHGEDGMQAWDVVAPATGRWFIHCQYASGQKRSVELHINGETMAGRCFGRETGGFFARDLAWETCGPFELRAGENSIRITTKGLMPHLAGLVVSRQREIADREVFASLFPEVPDHPDLAIDTDTTATREALRQQLPGVEEVLFVRRKTLQSSHYYTDFIDGCRHFGSDLCALDLRDGSVRVLAPELSRGIFGRCDLSFDGRRVVFGWKESLDVGFRIWEVGIDGKELRQLTSPPPDEEARIEKYRLRSGGGYLHHTDDLHPCYLPDGGICFSSTRCEYGILCDGPDKLTTGVLYRMDADGGNIEKLSNNSVSESAPAVMNDGRIVYTRWEYVDNGSVTNKGLWSVRPDGTGAEEIYGMSVAFPSVFNVARPVPGSASLFVSIGAPHMPLGVGTLMLVDSGADRRTGEGVSYITPEVDVRHQWGWDNVPGGATKPIPPSEQEGRDGRGNTDRGPLYMDPFPLSAWQFLVSFNPRKRPASPRGEALTPFPSPRRGEPRPRGAEESQRDV